MEPLCARSGDLWQLNLDALFHTFITSIGTYQARLQTDRALRIAFKNAFERYGGFFFGQLTT